MKRVVLVEVSGISSALLGWSPPQYSPECKLEMRIEIPDSGTWDHASSLTPAVSSQHDHILLVSQLHP